MLATKRICRVRIAKEELEKMSKEDFHKSWLLQEQYVDFIESKLNDSSEHMELVSLRESEEKLKQQQLEATRRENILVMRLTTKEQEMQEYAGQIQELKQAQIPSVAQLRSALLDPAVNLMFERMRKEMDSLKARLEETQNELNAWKFTPDSNTGKRLMAKCRLLYQENEELGKMISSGRMAKLEGDLALQKSFSEEMKKSQSELDEFLLELDEDVEGMQSTIYYLQQQLREAKEQILKLQKDKLKLSGLPNNSPANHHVVLDDNIDAESEAAIGFAAPGVETTSVVHSNQPILPITNDLNRTEGMSNPKPDRGTNAGRPWSPPPYDDKRTDPHLKSTSSKGDTIAEQEKNTEVITSVEQSVPQIAVNVTEISQVENINSLTSHVPFTAARGSLHMEEYDSEQETDSLRTVGETGSSEMIVGESTEEPEKRATTSSNRKSVTDSLNKRTSENGSKSRKRTRSSRVLTEQSTIDEDSSRDLPTVKRLRHRDVVVPHGVPEGDQKRTALEIDTDTEVQVAQTLAWWAAAKQERKEVCINSQELASESLGNGELKGNKKTSEGKV